MGPCPSLNLGEMCYAARDSKHPTYLFCEPKMVAVTMIHIFAPVVGEASPSPGAPRDGVRRGLPHGGTSKHRPHALRVPRLAQFPTSHLHAASPSQGPGEGLGSPFSTFPCPVIAPFSRKKPSHSFPHLWLMQ